MQITQQDRNKLATIHNLASMKFDLKAIPPELKELSHWKRCHLIGDIGPNKTKTTSPKVAEGGASPFGQITFNELTSTLKQDQYQHAAWYLEKNPEDQNGYVFLDVDNLPEQFTEDDIPQVIRDLTTLCPTYAEISPSGTGLRVIYHTDRTSPFLSHGKVLQCKAKTDTKLYVNTCYVTITGHEYLPLSKSNKVIYQIDPARLADLLLASKARKVQPISSTLASPTLGLQKPRHTLKDLTRWLMAMPQTLSQSKFKPILDRTYESFNNPLTNQADYEHWQRMAQAVHYGAAVLNEVENGADLFETWSSLDPYSETSVEEARQKYFDNAPKFDGFDLTEQTLARLFHALKPRWPFPAFEGRGDKRVPTENPVVPNMANWQALFDHFEIKLEQNEINKQYRFYGMSHIMLEYFKGSKDYLSKEAIISDVHYFANTNGFTQASETPASHFSKRLITSTISTYNPVKRWIDEEHERKPYSPNEGSYFQQLWETLSIPKAYEYREDLYRSYMKKNLMGIIRAHYYTGQFKHTTGMVILRGPEKCRKSSWVGLLLTQDLKDYVFASQTEPTKSVVKELQLEAGVCQIMLRDEVEVLMQQNDSALKNFLSQEDDAYRPLFGNTPIKVPRKSIIFGTTNQHELRISNNGSRRLMVIPVKYCDTDALLEIPLARMYLELKYEFDNTPQREQPSLWVLDDKEAHTTNQINSDENSSSSDLGMTLQEVFRLDAPFNIKDFYNSKGTIARKGPRLLTHTQVKTLIALQTGIPSHQIKGPAMKNELKRVLGTWSDTTIHDIEEGNWTITQGWATCTGPGSNKIVVSGWLIPLLRSEEIPIETEMT